MDQWIKEGFGLDDDLAREIRRSATVKGLIKLSAKGKGLWNEYYIRFLYHLGSYLNAHLASDMC